MQKMKKAFCLQCGSLLKVLPLGGELAHTSFGEEYVYKQLFNMKTGKPYMLYRCPNWKVIKGVLFTSDSTNGHTNVAEYELEDELENV